VSFLCAPTHPGDAPRCPEQRFTCHYGRNHHPRHGWINKAIAAFTGCNINDAGQKFLRLANSVKNTEFSILNEFIQMKSFGHKKTRACRFSVLIRILAMLPGAQSNALRAIMAEITTRVMAGLVSTRPLPSSSRDVTRTMPVQNSGIWGIQEKVLNSQF